MVSQAQHIQSSIQQVITLNQIGSLGLELGIDSGFTNIIGLSLSAIQGNIITNPGTTLEVAFNNIRPELFSSLAQYGIDRLGTSLGLDPRIATAIGVPIGAAIGAGIRDGNLFGQGIINVINESIKGGFVAVGTQFLMDKLPDNLGGSFLASVLTNSFNRLINPTSPVNIVDAFLNSLGDLGQKLLSPNSLNQLVQAVSSLGLKEGLERHAQDAFERSTIEAMVQTGGSVFDFVGTRLAYAADTVFQGIQAKKVDLSTGQADVKIYYQETPDGLKFLGYEETNGFVDLTDSGPTLLSGDISRYYDGNTTLTQVIENGKTTNWEVRDKASNSLLLEITPGTEGNYGSIQNFFQNSTLIFENNGRIDFTVTLPDGLRLSTNPTDLSSMSPEKQKALTSYVLLNGIANQEAIGVSPDSMIDFKNGLKAEGVNERLVALFPLYENNNIIDDALQFVIPYDYNNIIDDSGAWILDELGTNIVTNRVKTMLDNQFAGLTSEEKAQGIVAFAHSGGFNPLLRALDQKDYNVTAIVTYEGPSFEGIYNTGTTTNTHLQRIVKIYGTKDWWIPNAEKPIQFSGIDTFNIQIEGAGHGDFDYSDAKWAGSNDLIAKEINFKTAEFTAKATRAAGDQQDWSDFLASIQDGVEYDSQKNVYKIDPLKLRYQNE